MAKPEGKKHPIRKPRKSKKKVLKKIRDKVKRKKRLPSKRSILKGPKSPWIFFCEEHRDDVRKNNPDAKFGDICKILGPRWRALSPDQRRPYEAMSAADKRRYLDEKANLSEDKLKLWRKIRLAKKKKRRENRPPPPLSAYMFFVMKNRHTIAKANPTASFMEIGKILGKMWNQMDANAREPYIQSNMNDKLRYNQELEDFKNKAAAVVPEAK